MLRGSASSLFLVLRHLNSANRLKLLRILLDSKPPTVKDWLGLGGRQFDFSRGIHFRVIRLLTLAVIAFSLAEIIQEFSQSTSAWRTRSLVFCGIILIASVMSILVFKRAAVGLLLLSTPVAIFFATLLFLKLIPLPLICIIWVSILIILIGLWNNALKQRRSSSRLIALFDRISSSLK